MGGFRKNGLISETLSSKWIYHISFLKSHHSSCGPVDVWEGWEIQILPLIPRKAKPPYCPLCSSSQGASEFFLCFKQLTEFSWSDLDIDREIYVKKGGWTQSKVALTYFFLWWWLNMAGLTTLRSTGSLHVEVIIWQQCVCRSILCCGVCCVWHRVAFSNVMWGWNTWLADCHYFITILIIKCWRHLSTASAKHWQDLAS